MIRVLLPDDHAVVRDGLRALLDAQADIEVLGDAANWRDVLRQALQLRPDVVVIHDRTTSTRGFSYQIRNRLVRLT